MDLETHGTRALMHKIESCVDESRVVLHLMRQMHPDFGSHFREESHSVH